MQGSRDWKNDPYGPSDPVPATQTSKSFETRTCEIFENAEQNGPQTCDIKMYGPREPESIQYNLSNKNAPDTHHEKIADISV